MSIITIISDWQKSDYYLAAVKGKILGYHPNANIIDIAHQIPTHNLSKASFVIRNSFHHFPLGSIHIIAVRSEKTEKNKHIAIQYEGHFFIGTDNGIFGLFINEQPDKIIELSTNNVNSTFPELDVFAKAAAHLSLGNPLEALGSEIKEFKRSTPIRATFDENFINGSVIYSDSYRNAITNISKDLFERIGRGRKFDIYVQSFSNKNKISSIKKCYSEAPTGELVALFNSVNLLEIAINEGEVVDLFGLEQNKSIIIKFYNSN